MCSTLNVCNNHIWLSRPSGTMQGDKTSPSLFDHDTLPLKFVVQSVGSLNHIMLKAVLKHVELA